MKASRRSALWVAALAIVPALVRADPCEVLRVIDGDTLDVHCAGAPRERVRLLRIDTPERGRPGYEAASDALRALLGDGPVELEYEEPGVPVRDAYGRLLAYVVADGRVVNVEMVRGGWSPFWTRYGEGRLADTFREAEAEARARARATPPDVPGPDPRVRAASDCRARETCCRVCAKGRACGASCIRSGDTCRKGRGCACDASEVCR